jgi:hypothetical protein
MNRRNLLTSLFGLIPLAGTRSFARDPDDKHHGKKKGQNHDHRGDYDSHYFRTEDYGVIKHYYRAPRHLPPGLRKKYYRTGTLPPGWQKNFQPFPAELVRQLPPPPPNCERGYIDGVAVVYDRTTRVILDSIDLVNAIADH